MPRLERLRLDLECADVTGMDRAFRIIGRSVASLRHLKLSLGKRQLDDGTTVAAVGSILCRLRLDHLYVRLSFSGVESDGAPCLIRSVLHADALWVSLQIDLCIGLCIDSFLYRCCEEYFAFGADDGRSTRDGRRLDITFGDENSELVSLNSLLLLCGLTAFHTLRGTIHPAQRLSILQDFQPPPFFLGSTIRCVTLNIVNVHLTDCGYLSMMRSVTALPHLETFECDARENQISDVVFSTRNIDYSVPVAWGRMLVRVTGDSELGSAADEWNRWIRGLCPLLGDCDGVFVTAPTPKSHSLVTATLLPRFDVDTEVRRRTRMVEADAGKRQKKCAD
jgi:hypothetical protein